MVFSTLDNRIMVFLFTIEVLQPWTMAPVSLRRRKVDRDVDAASAPHHAMSNGYRAALDSALETA
jgi:hypothetical protein